MSIAIHYPTIFGPVIYCNLLVLTGIVVLILMASCGISAASITFLDEKISDWIVGGLAIASLLLVIGYTIVLVLAAFSS